MAGRGTSPPVLRLRRAEPEGARSAPRYLDRRPGGHACARAGGCHDHLRGYCPLRRKDAVAADGARAVSHPSPPRLVRRGERDDGRRRRRSGHGRAERGVNARSAIRLPRRPTSRGSAGVPRSDALSAAARSGAPAGGRAACACACARAGARSRSATGRPDPACASCRPAARPATLPPRGWGAGAARPLGFLGGPGPAGTLAEAVGWPERRLPPATSSPSRDHAVASSGNPARAVRSASHRPGSSAAGARRARFRPNLASAAGAAARRFAEHARPALGQRNPSSGARAARRDARRTRARAPVRASRPRRGRSYHWRRCATT